MEVHHHSHAAGHGKKWTHYFWEFLMLFLAVFCGFLAEYKLEHTIEHQREKQFMKSLVEDLRVDTLELQKAIRVADRIARYSDSSLYILVNYQQDDTIPIGIAQKISRAGQRIDLINTDRTSSQLKNSGGMRLIRKQNVSDSILSYWKQIEETKIDIDRYMIYRDAARSILFRLWVIPNVYISGLNQKMESLTSLRVIDKDKKKWDELTNLIAISGAIVRNGHMQNLQRQLEKATSLITLIMNEYKIK